MILTLHTYFFFLTKINYVFPHLNNNNNTNKLNYDGTPSKKKISREVKQDKRLKGRKFEV